MVCSEWTNPQPASRLVVARGWGRGPGYGVLFQGNGMFLSRTDMVMSQHGECTKYHFAVHLKRLISCYMNFTLSCRDQGSSLRLLAAHPVGPGWLGGM